MSDPWTISPDGIVSVAAESFAAAVVEKLSASVIPSSIPAEVGQWVRATATHGSFWWQFSIPMAGATSMGTRWKLHPDGTIGLELTDTNGQIFWRGTFRPAEREASA